MDKVKFKRVIAQRGNSPTIAIPSEIMEYLNINVGETIEIIGDNRKHGRFMAIYKKEE